MIFHLLLTMFFLDFKRRKKRLFILTCHQSLAWRTRSGCFSAIFLPLNFFFSLALQKDGPAWVKVQIWVRNRIMRKIFGEPRKWIEVTESFLPSVIYFWEECLMVGGLGLGGENGWKKLNLGFFFSQRKFWAQITKKERKFCERLGAKLSVAIIGLKITCPEKFGICPRGKVIEVEKNISFW